MKGQREGIKCGLKVNGTRMLIFNMCKEHCCEWWGECMYQLGHKVSNKWEEVDPTAEEVEKGLGHEVNGEIKIWKKLSKSQLRGLMQEKSTLARITMKC